MAEKKQISEDSLENIKILKARALSVESKTAKSFSGGRDIESEIEDLRSSCLETASDYYDYTNDEFAGCMAEKFRKPMSFEPTEVALVLKDIVADISELYVRAFKLMLENLSHSHLVKVETSYENDVFEKQWRREQKYFEKLQRKEAKIKIKDKDGISTFIDNKKDNNIIKPRRLRRRAEAEAPSFNSESSRPSRRYRPSSNLVFTRSSEFRAAKPYKPSFRRSKSESSSNGPQMSF